MIIWHSLQVPLRPGYFRDLRQKSRASALPRAPTLEAVLVLAAAVADAFRPRCASLQRSPCSATSSPSFNARSPRRAWRGSTESSWSHSRPSPRRGETSCASPNPRPFFAGTVPASRLFGGGGVKRHPASRLATETATLIRAMASGTTVRSRRNPESVTEEGKGAQTRRHVAYTTRTDPICRSAATRRSRAPSNRRTRPIRRASARRRPPPPLLEGGVIVPH